MPLTALKSESTVLALKLKKSVRKAREALTTAGSCTGPLLLLVAYRTANTRAAATPRAARRLTRRKARRLGALPRPPPFRGFRAGGGDPDPDTSVSGVVVSGV